MENNSEIMRPEIEDVTQGDAERVSTVVERLQHNW